MKLSQKNGAHEEATVNQFLLSNKKKKVLDGSINLLASAV